MNELIFSNEQMIDLKSTYTCHDDCQTKLIYNKTLVGIKTIRVKKRYI